MTNILLALILIALGGIGYLLYRIFLIVREPKKVVKNAEVAVTAGSYAPTYSGTNDNPVGISEAKTPQLIEFEAEQLLLKQNQSLGR